MNAWFQFVAGNIVVATLIGVLAWQVGRSGRRARMAHLLWVAVFVKLITPPIVLLPISVPERWLPVTAASVTNSFPYRGFRPSAIEGPANNASAGGVSGAMFSTGGREAGSSWFFPATWFLPAIDAWTCLALIWVLGMVVVLVRGLMRFIRFHRLLLREGTRDEEASAFVQRLLRPSRFAQVTAERGPRVLRIPIRVSPMLFGFGSRPAIVCPDQLWQSLSENDRHAFLAHETAHYYRRDHWVRWLEWIVTAAYWWFPGVYVARRQLERHEEACCDAWAVRRLDASPRQYAEALLRVVDFISEHNARMPRLASGMQPTESLEERLRLLMQGCDPDDGSSALRFSAAAACISLWLVHPIPLPLQPLAVEADSIGPISTEASTVIDAASLPAVTAPLAGRAELPEAPIGFWNRPPAKQWADFSLRLPGARLVAESARGVSIEVPNRDPLRFSLDELSAIVEVPSTQRVVIGDRVGRLRLWDLSAGVAVSLIGQHASSVTSIDYHEAGGLVSADEGGSVMHWDLQSGQVLATWSSSAISTNSPADDSVAIQSVRYAADGSTLAILTGRWSDMDRRQSLFIVQARSLETISSMDVPPGTAVVFPLAEFGWVTVDWSGAVRSIESQATITTIDKHSVSALVLSHRSSRSAMDPILH